MREGATGGRFWRGRDLGGQELLLLLQCQGCPLTASGQGYSEEGALPCGQAFGDVGASDIIS